MASRKSDKPRTRVTRKQIEEFSKPQSLPPKRVQRHNLPSDALAAHFEGYDVSYKRGEVARIEVETDAPKCLARLGFPHRHLKAGVPILGITLPRLSPEKLLVAVQKMKLPQL